MGVPVLFMSGGLGFKTSTKTELVFSANEVVTLDFFSVGIRSNLNYKLYESEPTEFYIPFWLGYRFGKENHDEYVAKNYECNIGSGLGYKLKFKNHHFLKFELGAGVLLENCYSPFSLSGGLLFDSNINRLKITSNLALSPTLRLNVRYAIPFGSL